MEARNALGKEDRKGLSSESPGFGLNDDSS